MSRVFLGTRKGLIQIDKQNGNWAIARVSFLGQHVSMLLPDRRIGVLHAGLNLGHFGAKMHRSTDAGASWEETAVPAYPPKPADVDDRDHWGKPIPWSTQQIWSLEAGNADQPGLLWCGTIPGGLFRSRDAGTSWELVHALWNHPKRRAWFGGGADLPGIHSICVDPNDGNHVGVGVSCGGYWVTADGGENWECRAQGMRAAYMPPEGQFDPNIQDPHRVVQCQGSPDHLWAQHHNGIFRSTDNAVSWQEINDVQPSAFGFAVVVHPREPDTAWFIPGVKDECRIPVGGKLIVTRTRDGGKSFTPLAKGLPQEHAYDIVFRHALDIDESGNNLAFGSTTGSAWISEDQGDSWQCLSTHLPPIYCVRFARA